MTVCAVIMLVMAVYFAPAASASTTTAAIPVVTSSIYHSSSPYQQVFFDETYRVRYGSGDVILAYTPDGLSGGVVDDWLWVDVTHEDSSTANAMFDYSNGCTGLAQRPPRDITDLLEPGINQIQIRMQDGCGGSNGAWPMYIVHQENNIVIDGASFLPPTMGDQFLQRTVSLTMASGSDPWASVEYSWTNDPYSTGPTGPIRGTGSGPGGAVDFGDTSPDSLWSLYVRGVGSDGGAGPWYQMGWITTPKRPLIIALGDSITSGHHRDTNDPVMTCDDEDYGYPKYVQESFSYAAPPQWAVQYVNFAHSGFSTDQVISGDDHNICGDEISPSSPLVDATAALEDNLGSWNYVVISAGIDNTNWIEQLAEIGGHNASQFSYTEQDCEDDLSDWSGNDAEVVGANITDDVATIANDLIAMDPMVKTQWLEYYNIAGTGPIPHACDAPFFNAKLQLKGYIEAAMNAGNFTMVSTDSAIPLDSGNIQAYQVPWDTEQGWPHPNSTGAYEIAQYFSR